MFFLDLLRRSSTGSKRKSPETVSLLKALNSSPTELASAGTAEGYNNGLLGLRIVIGKRCCILKSQSAAQADDCEQRNRSGGHKESPGVMLSFCDDHFD